MYKVRDKRKFCIFRQSFKKIYGFDIATFHKKSSPNWHNIDSSCTLFLFRSNFIFLTILKIYNNKGKYARFM